MFRLISLLYNIHYRRTTTLMVLIALLLYIGDRSFLVNPPKRSFGDIIYSLDSKLETGKILPGKLTANLLIEVEEEEEEVIVPPLNLNIGDTDIVSLYNEAYQVNNDVVGYIYIPDSKIQYPILYKDTKDNYYLTHDINNNKSSYGCIYLEDASDGKFSNVNLIHGHSMRDKSMFGQLLYYKTQDWADEHKLIYVYDGETTRVYGVFACIIVNAYSEQVPLDFGSEEERDVYYSKVFERSKIKGFDLDMPDDVLMLNTCSYEADNMRALVYSTRLQAVYDSEGFIDME